MSWITRIAAVTIGLLSLAACSWLPWEGQRAGERAAAERQQLNSSLNVASASADAGQFEAAERLYTQLARHFPNAPEPRLGRAYLALRAGDFTLAGKFFAEAEERSTTPAAKAEALLGAGRASLGKRDVAGAKARFQAASDLAKDTPAEAWIANGLGVVATLEGDHERARKHYAEAIESSSSHPMITANMVRALARAGAEDEARQLYAKYPASHWLDGDGAALSNLLAEKGEPRGVEGPGVALSNPSKAKEDASTQGSVPLDAQVQIYSARSQAGALAAWTRLSSAEQDLLDSLTPRVVKARIRGKGEVYRLRAGPLAGKSVARRLCGLLKGRGRDCFVPAAKWTTGNGTVPGGPRRGAEPGPVAQTASDDWPGPVTPPGPAQETMAAPSDTAAAEPSGKAPEPEDAPGAQVQIFSARSRAGALAAWGRLSSLEKDLLGALTPRVEKAEVPGKGVVYRLRVGPMADKAAAKRLCILLKGRGRDCFVPAGK